MKRETIQIKKSDLNNKAPRQGVMNTKIVPDKTKYSRKTKHKGVYA